MQKTVPVDGGMLDLEPLGHRIRLDLLTALQHQRARLDAQEQRLLHALATDPLPADYGFTDGSDGLGKHWARDDIACAMRIPPATAADRIATAATLVTRLPETLNALGRGELSRLHAVRLAEAIQALPDPVAAQLEAQVLPRASVQTAAQFALSVRRAVAALDPRDPDQVHEDAVAKRRVVFRPQPDGMSELWALLPAERAAALKARLDADTERGKGLDQRTADQRRADALTDLALCHPTGSTGAGVKPNVNVTVALSTLLHLDDQPGELAGHGPIPAPLARALAFDPTGSWRRLLTDEHGNLIELSTDSYRPAAPITRTVHAAQHSCVFPGCRRPAHRCQLDHIVAWADGGTTTPTNLQPLCPRHHHLKHETTWQVHRQPDGNTRWRSPVGHQYTRPPDQRPLDRTATIDDRDRVGDDPPF